MRASKFGACFFLYFLHTAAPHLIQGPMSYDTVLRQHGDNGTNPSDFHYLVTGGYRPQVNDLVRYAVSLRLGEAKMYFGSNHVCGGSIVTPKAILTAGHCLFSRRGSQVHAKKMRVFAGTPKRLEEAPSTQEMRVRKLLPYPKYRSGKYRHDLGLVLLRDELTMNGHVAIIPLNNRAPNSGLRCTVVGWGTVIQFGPSPDEAVNGDVEILPTHECQKLSNFNPKGMICAKNRDDSEVDSCQGDSGGPLICNNMLAGIVSFGEGCGEKYSAGVYTDVYYYRDWIIENSAPQVWQMFQVSQVSLLLALALLLAAC